MAEGMTRKYLIVDPAALLRALEMVEEGVSAFDVMTAILDVAEESEVIEADE